MKVAVTGATGFLGRHVLARLARAGASVRILTRRADAGVTPDVEVVRGDLREHDAIRRLLAGVDALVHLAYAEDVSEAANGEIARSLAAATPPKFVHVSTAVVVGAVPDAVITEETRPNPRNPYEQGKLRIEHVLHESITDGSLTIVRPSAIFGPGGQGLLKHIHDLRHDAYPVRAIRRALLRSRRLNLVPVDNVVEAIWYAMTVSLPGTFIVSDDDAPENNFGDVTAFLAGRMGVAVPRVPDLTPILGPLLRLRGRSLANPHAIFSPAKLLAAGFKPPVTFREGLEKFMRWYLDDGAINR